MKTHAKFQEASSIGNTQKSRGTVKRLTKIIIILIIIILMTKIWAQNRQFDKVITFEPNGILTRSKRRYVHLGEVNK